MVAARRPDRLHQNGWRRIPHRGDDPVGRRRADADQQLAGRSADLVAERARDPVLPHHAGPYRQVDDLAGRPDRREPAPPADTARRLRPELGPHPALAASGTKSRDWGCNYYYNDGKFTAQPN